jgi:chromosome segregation ATPase
MKLKKVLLVGGIVALGVAFIGTGTVKKYASYARQEIQSLADKAGTPEREIERLREEVKKLDKVEREMKDELAQEIVQCDGLAKKVAELRTKATSQRAEAESFGETVKTAAGRVSLGKGTLSQDEAKRHLKTLVSAAASQERTVASLETTLVHREASKNALKGQVTEIQTLREQLSNELDQLEAEYRAIKLAGMKNKYVRDENKWSAIRQGIEDLKQKIEVKKVRHSLDTGAGHTDAPVTESVEDILAPLTGKKGD